MQKMVSDKMNIPQVKEFIGTLYIKEGAFCPYGKLLPTITNATPNMEAQNGTND